MVGRVAFIVGVLVGFGCSPDVGLRLVFRVDSELSASLLSSTIRVESASPDAPGTRPVLLEGLSADDLPITVDVRPLDGDESRKAYVSFEVEATGCAVRSERVLSMTPGEFSTVDYLLVQACCDNSCGSGEACFAGDGTVCAPVCEGGTTFDPTARTCAEGPGGRLLPAAQLRIEPLVGTLETTFSFSIELAEPVPGELSFEWDFDDDGEADSTSPMPQTQLAGDGVVSIGVRVRGADGRIAEAVGHVVIAQAADILVVTTDSDSVNASDGELSLREAAVEAAASSTPQTITFSGPMTIQLTERLDVEAVGARLVGAPGVVLDGTSISGNDCLALGASNMVVLGMEIRNCQRHGILVRNPSSGTWVLHNQVRNGRAINAAGIWVGRGSEHRIGPGNLISGQVAGIQLAGRDNRVFGNRAQNNGTGIIVEPTSPDDTAVVAGIRIAANELVGNQVGARIHAEVQSVEVFHNTVVDSVEDGVVIESSALTRIVANNLVAFNAGAGIRADSRISVGRGLFFDNGAGPCTGGCVVGAQAIDEAPGFYDRANEDFRLGPESPAIDAGEPLDLDRNGARAGRFNGSGPDLGANESPR
ncbi:MAG: right-handed parallel beta-helix repeat-containing protein [Myxococcota bacterium]